MKVTQEDAHYKPIIVKLETKKEAQWLRHIVNCGSGMTMDEYLKCHADAADIKYFSHHLWSKLRDIIDDC